jgi:hypothetical protein
MKVCEVTLHGVDGAVQVFKVAVEGEDGLCRTARLRCRKTTGWWSAYGAVARQGRRRAAQQRMARWPGKAGGGCCSGQEIRGN